MTPTISEFSYGFALTHELIGLAEEPLRAAPVFPSLIEEGKAGGGYDVNLDIPGFTLFMQFKRSDCLGRGNTRELKKGLPLNLPYYRFGITERRRSSQHQLLLALDDGSINEVFYAAPRFHEVNELNGAYLAREVANKSFYIRPRDIGPLLDDEAHYVAFDEYRQFVCSDHPHEVMGYRGQEMNGELVRRLENDPRPLRGGPIAQSLQVTRRALHERGVEPDTPDFGRTDKTEEERQIRILADLALRYFGAQLFLMQRRLDLAGRIDPGGG